MFLTLVLHSGLCGTSQRCQGKQRPAKPIGLPETSHKQEGHFMPAAYAMKEQFGGSVRKKRRFLDPEIAVRPAAES